MTDSLIPSTSFADAWIQIDSWLKPEGVLILVVPAERVTECSQILAGQFKNVRLYRLTEPASQKFWSESGVASAKARDCRTLKSHVCEATIQG